MARLLIAFHRTSPTQFPDPGKTKHFSLRTDDHPGAYVHPLLLLLTIYHRALDMSVQGGWQRVVSDLKMKQECIGDLYSARDT